MKWAGIDFLNIGYAWHPKAGRAIVALMDAREECLDHLLRFVQSGDIDQAAVAAGTALAYLATLEGKNAQTAALRRLRSDLASLTEEARISGEAEDRHIAIEDALTKACATIEGTSA